MYINKCMHADSYQKKFSHRHYSVTAKIAIGIPNKFFCNPFLFHPFLCHLFLCHPFLFLLCHNMVSILYRKHTWVMIEHIPLISISLPLFAASFKKLLGVWVTTPLLLLSRSMVVTANSPSWRTILSETKSFKDHSCTLNTSIPYSSL